MIISEDIKQTIAKMVTGSYDRLVQGKKLRIADPWILAFDNVEDMANEFGVQPSTALEVLKVSIEWADDEHDYHSLFLYCPKPDGTIRLYITTSVVEMAAFIAKHGRLPELTATERLTTRLDS